MVSRCLRSRHHKRPQRIDSRAHSFWHPDRGVGRIDQRRPAQGMSGQQSLAIIDGNVAQTAFTPFEADRAASGQRRGRAGSDGSSVGRSRASLLGFANANRADRYQFDWRAQNQCTVAISPRTVGGRSQCDRVHDF